MKPTPIFWSLSGIILCRGSSGSSEDFLRGSGLWVKNMVAHVIFLSIKPISSFVGTARVYMVLNLKPMADLEFFSGVPNI